MLIVGLTGGIATGKSTVAEMFVSLGAYIVDTDRISRQIVEPGSAGLQQVVDCFGREILAADNSLDRKKLGAVVFSSPEKRKMLEALLHPRIFEEKNRQIEAIRSKDSHAIVLVDVPLLIEVGGHIHMDGVVLVYASPQVQLARIMARDNLTSEEAVSRIAAQMRIDDKVQYADYVIHNEGHLEETRNAVADVFQQLRKEEQRRSAAFD